MAILVQVEKSRAIGRPQHLSRISNIGRRLRINRIRGAPETRERRNPAQLAICLQNIKGRRQTGIVAQPKGDITALVRKGQPTAGQGLQLHRPYRVA